MKVTMNGASCSTFCGYHGHFTYGGFDIRYAVFPYLDCNACKLSNLTVADMMTIVASHEIREAVTDPHVERVVRQQGLRGGRQVRMAQPAIGWRTDGFAVQPEYSNGDARLRIRVPGCVVANPPTLP